MHEALTLWTIGHSNRPVAELIAMLTQAAIATRMAPFQSHHPQPIEVPMSPVARRTSSTTGRTALGESVPCNSIAAHCADEGRRGFADHMGTEIFKKAVSQFVSATRADRDAVRRTRSRALPSRWIADYLTLRGYASCI
jgi:hypothetical protein